MKEGQKEGNNKKNVTLSKQEESKKKSGKKSK